MFLRKIIGFHSCKEALKVRSSSELKQLYFKPDWNQNPALLELAELAEKKQLKPKILSVKKMNQIGEAHQGVCLFVSAKASFDLKSLAAHSVLFLLDRIQDPKNLGAIIRTCWLMGGEGIFISSRESVALTPSVNKAASGGLEHIPVEVKNNLQQFIKILKENQFWIYGLDSQANNSLWKEPFKGRVAFVLGGEKQGIRQSLKKSCDKMLFIPQKQNQASYNVSVTAGLVLGEYFRQRSLDV